VSWIFGALVLAGSYMAARLPDDPLGEALATVLHAEVDDVEPTITCTPEEETT
jgi:hypothetical protein